MVEKVRLAAIFTCVGMVALGSLSQKEVQECAWLRWSLYAVAVVCDLWPAASSHGYTKKKKIGISESRTYCMYQDQRLFVRYVLVDFEHAGPEGEIFDEGEHLAEWDEKTLQDSAYTRQSDLYQYGKLLGDRLAGIESEGNTLVRLNYWRQIESS